MKEIWVPVSTNELYEVSNLGRVRSWNNHGKNPRSKPKILSQTDKGGYKYVHINKNTKANAYTVHRLVAKAFIPNPDNKRTVNHLDKNRGNNHVENLEWTTHSENERHAKAIKITLTKDEVVKRFDCLIDAADFLGVHRANISKLRRGRVKTVYGWAMLK